MRCVVAPQYAGTETLIRSIEARFQVIPRLFLPNPQNACGINPVKHELWSTKKFIPNVCFHNLMKIESAGYERHLFTSALSKWLIFCVS